MRLNHPNTAGKEAALHPRDHAAAHVLPEQCFAAAELAVVIGLIVIACIFPTLLMLPIMALAAMLLVAIALWDDRLHERR